MANRIKCRQVINSNMSGLQDPAIIPGGTKSSGIKGLHLTPVLMIFSEKTNRRSLTE